MKCASKFGPAIKLLTLIGIVGCGTSDNVVVYPVRGTIRLEGNAVPGGGSIAFVPMDPKQAGKSAGGEIREDGTYVLSTYGNGDGSMTGYFRVLITQATTVEPREAIPDGQKLPPGGMPIRMVSPDDCIPAIYSNPGKSPLKATVEPRTNEINFDLQRKLEPAGDSVPPGVAHWRSGRTIDRRIATGDGATPLVVGVR